MPKKVKLPPEVTRITREMYKKNLELVERNKTLALLRAIDEALLQAPLGIQSLAQEITGAVISQTGFIALAWILFRDKKIPSRFVSAAASLAGSRPLLKTALIEELLNTSIVVKKETIAYEAIRGKTIRSTNRIDPFFKEHFSRSFGKHLHSVTQVESLFICPLISRKNVLGILVLGAREKSFNLSPYRRNLISRLSNTVAIVVDNRKLYEELQEAYTEVDRLSKAKSEFISIASHQLRTPLTAIKGYISMILEGTYGRLPQEASRPMKNVYESNERLVHLINDLLEVSRIEAGRIELEPEPTHIEELIEGVVQELLITAQQRKLYLNWEKPKAPLPQLFIDKTKMRQAILNLLNNAIKYTKEGGITLKTQGLDGKIQISIKDTGEGMTKEDLGKIFQSFSRGTTGTQLSAEGAGLGLYIAKKFVEMHKGKIWAESAGKSKGSTFHIELPVK